MCTDTVFWAWGISAALIVALAAALGFAVGPQRGVLGILIDRRGRFSLTHFQLTAWSIVVLSLISGIFWGRLLEDAKDPLSFSIPSEVLGLLGITFGSAVAAGVTKSAKDETAGARIAASNEADPPRLAQIFLLEEGHYADKVIDIAKFQNFVITLVLLVAYVALAIDAISGAKTLDDLDLPGFSATFLTLLGISHGAYIAAKLPTQEGIPPGLTVQNRLDGEPDQLPPGVIARNA